MKYCPNLDCSYLEITGQIAEYQDQIDVCPDCDTELVDGEAPFVLPRSEAKATQNAALFPSELTSVSAVDSYDDALWLKDELEKAGIPAMIRVAEDEESSDDSPANLEIGDDNSTFEEAEGQESPLPPDNSGGAIPSFEIKVMDRYALAAIDLIQTFLEEENGAGEGWDDEDSDIASDEEIDALWEENSAHSGTSAPRFMTNPLVVLFSLFCALLAIAYLLLIGFPGGPF